MAVLVSCTMSVTGGQLNNVRLQVDATGRLTLSHTVSRIVGVVATVAMGGSMTVSSSQLVHGSATDPFPCDGHDMHCTGPHAQAVTLSGPASINTNAPLICPPGGGDWWCGGCFKRVWWRQVRQSSIVSQVCLM
jgi:hypothetical protein